MRPRHIPLRTCVSCRTSGDKRGLLRVARQPDGLVVFDRTGKTNGRGAYVCANPSCIGLAKKQNKFARSLKTQVTAEVFETLLAVASALAPIESNSPEKGQKTEEPLQANGDSGTIVKERSAVSTTE